MARQEEPKRGRARIPRREETIDDRIARLLEKEPGDSVTVSKLSGMKSAITRVTERTISKDEAARILREHYEDEVERAEEEEQKQPRKRTA